MLIAEGRRLTVKSKLVLSLIAKALESRKSDVFGCQWFI